jgi:NifB/MoaA-like Fe-S oxidoreductase
VGKVRMREINEPPHLNPLPRRERRRVFKNRVKISKISGYHLLLANETNQTYSYKIASPPYSIHSAFL